MQFLIAGLIGLVSGVTSGLFGVGGGIVMVPAMMFFMKMDIKMA
ncbi:MAG TPA: TSUP family transporter, partial [Verrucomicrobiae bacterium]|nr:TSUP family transporter [Verrucomicrobiae bacterium]